MNDKNQGEYIVEQNGTYQMKIIFVAPLVPRINAEVEVDWA